jgi:hypothetical protein
MSSDEPFLARWSRRKRQSADEAGPDPLSDPADASAPNGAVAAPAESEREAATTADVDLSHLPSLESIDATTDIRAFLARGVPAALGRAALRRAWTADPAIRDFVGLSENAWDFTAPEGIPGFGPLAPNAAASSIAELGGRGPGVSLSTAARAEPAGSAIPVEPRPPSPQPASAERPDVHGNVNAGSLSKHSSTASSQTMDGRIADKQSEDVAARKPSIADEIGNGLPRRRHGGALPG